jgi:hypothetical protein
MEAAKVSGDPVTEAEIAAAVEQYYDRLHEFKEPPASFTKFLAHLWVLRGRLFKWLIGIVGAFALIFGLLAVRDAQQTAVRSNLFEQSVAAERAILAWDKAAPLKAALDAKLVEARAALDRGDVDALNRIHGELASLQSEFAADFAVTIVSEPNQISVRERLFEDRTSGFYAIVHARDSDGAAVPVKIHNREVDRVETLTQWGEQIPEEVFNRLAADKQADGVLDEREFAVKRPGTRELEIVLKGEDGQPIKRGGQITSW